MRKRFWKLLALAPLALALMLVAAAPSIVRAQDRPDDRHDDQSAEHRDNRQEPRPDEHRDNRQEPRPDEHRDDRRSDPADQYRHDHPNAAARCHDGFFTTTRDRNRACSKHGGIDVWLVL